MCRLASLLAGILVILTASIGYGYQVGRSFTSPVGGAFSAPDASSLIPQCDMLPYGKPLLKDLDPINDRATGLYSSGDNFLRSLSLYNCDGDPTCGGDTRLQNLLADPSLNYETAGFLDEFEEAKQNLHSALEAFAYLASYDYPDAELNLKRTFRDLMNIYLVFADEFLVDALHFRFTAELPNMDQYLQQQIDLLEKALIYYRGASDDFMKTALTAIGWSSQVAGSLFGDEEWDRVGLVFQRLNMTIREKNAKKRILMASPLNQIESELADSLSQLYVEGAILSKKLGEQFLDSEGKPILTAIETLRKQLLSMKSGLNPLGYDERYVPLANYEPLYQDAVNLHGEAQTEEAEVRAEQRAFDSQLSAYKKQLEDLDSNYRQALADLTGCDGALSNNDFEECARWAGNNLFADCPLDLDPDQFDQCMREHALPGQMSDMYRQIKTSDISLQQAVLHHDNVNEEIALLNQQMDYQVKIISQYFKDQIQALEDYRKAMKKAVVITKVSTTTKTKDRYGTVMYTQRTKQVEKQLKLKDTGFKAEIQKEKDVLKATRDFQIQQAKDPTVIKEKLLEEAEALLAIDLAVHNKNTMIATFDGALRRRDNLLAEWARLRSAYEHYNSTGLATERILLSEKVVRLSNTFNELAHYTYLASKALEYRYARPLDGINLGPTEGELDIRDLYKCQAADDFGDYLHKLDVWDGMWCDQPVQFQMNRYRISMATDILGLTRKNLGDLDGDGFVDETGRPVSEARYEKFQEFVNAHVHHDQQAGADVLEFSFPSSVWDAPLQRYHLENLKIWHQTPPCGGSAVGFGFTTKLQFRGVFGNLDPSVTVTMAGTHSLLKNGQQKDYWPIDKYSLMTAQNPGKPKKTETFIPYINVEPPVGTGFDPSRWAESFANLSPAVGEWTVSIPREPSDPEHFDDVPFQKLEDIWFYFDAIGESEL